MKKKVIEWARRYGLPLIIGYILTLSVAFGTKLLFGSLVLSAYLATWADNCGFYGTIAYRDLKARGKLSFSNFFKVVRNMIVEFGPAEYVDSLVIRPLFLATFPLFISNYLLAIFLGMLAGEVTFFIPVIIAYEFRKKAFKD